MSKRIILAAAFCGLLFSTSDSAAQNRISYKVVATSKTSTMQKELQEAGDAGYRFVAVMGGETAVGGKEVVVLLEKDEDERPGPISTPGHFKDLDVAERTARSCGRRLAGCRADSIRKRVWRKGDGSYLGAKFGAAVYSTLRIQTDRDLENVNLG